MFENSSVFCVCLFDVMIPDDDLKKTETCLSIRALHVKLYILMLVHLLALSVSVE
jgi:hypothetical protein